MRHDNYEGISIKKYNFIKVIGEGTWGRVYRAIDEQNDSQVAIKVIPKRLMRDMPKLEEFTKREIGILKQCNNANIIAYIDHFLFQNNIFIIMEYCNGGDLARYLVQKKQLPQYQAITFLKQIINGFQALQQIRVMHRDLKLENVLMHNGACKIADLGFAKQMKNMVTETMLGTCITMAPQVLRGLPYGFEADIWSLGVIFYQMIYGKYPFTGNSPSQLIRKINQTRPDFSFVEISDNSKSFIKGCLTISPQRRILWKQIYDHPLIKTEEKLELVKKSEKLIEDNRQLCLLSGFIMQKEVYHKQQAQLLQNYFKKYLNIRNNIMFMQKHITPLIFLDLMDIKANHQITLFIMSKKAYHQMKMFIENIRKKNNFLQLERFSLFSHSPKYTELQRRISEDLELISVQLMTYRQNIQRQLQYESIANSKWNTFVLEMIKDYQYQLSEALSLTKGEKKKHLIKVIEALIYLRENIENIIVEEFDRIIEVIDFMAAENRIKQRIAKTYFYK